MNPQLPWTTRTAAQLRKQLGGWHLEPWCRGMWLTTRQSYARVPLPSGARLDHIELDGATRRVAHIPGEGRPLLVLPGMYADIHEQLFVDIAQRAARTGRPVVLLEHRLAEETVKLSGAPDDPVDCGAAVTELCATLPTPPDVIALSAGLVDAWSAHGAWHRLAGFSGVRDPAAVARAIRRNPFVHAYYQRCHQRAGLEAQLPFTTMIQRLIDRAPLPDPGGEWLLVHAVDDPVVSIHTLDDLAPERVVKLPAGGHLGFGVLTDTTFFLLPFIEVSHA